MGRRQGFDGAMVAVWLPGTVVLACFSFAAHGWLTVPLTALAAFAAVRLLVGLGVVNRSDPRREEHDHRDGGDDREAGTPRRWWPWSE